MLRHRGGGGRSTYIFTREPLTNMGAMLLMIGIMLPCFLFAMYERDGLPFEKVLRNIARSTFLWPRVRPYKTDNFYAYLSKGGKRIETGKKAHSRKKAGR